LTILPTVALGGMMAAIAVPNFLKARASTQENRIQANLSKIARAKEQWALENNKRPGTEVTLQDLEAVTGKIQPVAGEEYLANPIGTAPEAKTTQAFGKFKEGETIPLEAPGENQ
jgi:Tfp pilus assembly protein PilE